MLKGYLHILLPRTLGLVDVIWAEHAFVLEENTIAFEGTRKVEGFGAGLNAAGHTRSLSVANLTGKTLTPRKGHCYLKNQKSIFKRDSQFE